MLALFCLMWGWPMALSPRAIAVACPTAAPTAAMSSGGRAAALPWTQGRRHNRSGVLAATVTLRQLLRANRHGG